MKHLREFAKSVPDYRRTGKGNHRHKLEDVLLLVILGRLGKCVTRADIIRFGNRHLKRFRALGLLLHGVPSEPTLCRIFKHIDDEPSLSMMSLSVLQAISSALTARRCGGQYLKTDVILISCPPIL